MKTPFALLSFLLNPILVIASLSVAVKAEPPAKTQPAVSDTQTSGAYLKAYASRFTNAMKASGQKVGAFSMSNKPEKDGLYHMGVEIVGSSAPKKLKIKFKGGVNFLHMKEAIVGKELIDLKNAKSWPLLGLWHQFASRQPGLPLDAVSVQFSKTDPKPVNRFLRTSDLWLGKDTAELSGSLRSDYYEMIILPKGYGADIRVNGSRSLAHAGKASLADFKKLVKGIDGWNIERDIQDVAKKIKIEDAANFYFSGSVSRVQDGTIIATYNPLYPPLPGGSDTSALVYFKSVDKEGNRELLIARAPLKLSDIDWDEVKKIEKEAKGKER